MSIRKGVFMKLNRRKTLSLLGASTALLAGASIRAQTENSTGSGEYQIEGLNPKGSPPPIELIPMAPRLDSLDGKTIYLIDTGFAGGGTLLQQMELWFKKNMPSVNPVFKRKAGPYAEDDPALWQEIKEQGHAAIMAIGH